MSKQRLQVLLEDAEFRKLRETAGRQGMTVAEWVRRALRQADSREPEGDLESKLSVLRNALSHEGPTGDIDQLLAEIERGQLGPPPG